MLFWKKKPLLPEIKIVKEYPQHVPSWNGSGIVFRVLNGKGKLRQAYGADGNNGLFSLMFDNIPLIRLHGDEYMCPTCEKLLSAGYGLDNSDTTAIETLRSALNTGTAPLMQMIPELAPLLGLLSSGFYALVETELYPTDGDGSFFWSVSNSPRSNAATCPIYEHGEWLREYPAFAVPSQSPTHFNPQRVEYYRSRPECRAVAFNIGFLNVLLDGHHKAVAAVAEGRKLKALVIVPATGLSYPHKSNLYKPKLNFGGECIELDELGISINVAKAMMSARRLDDRETRAALSLVNESFDTYSWPPELLDAAKIYPKAHTLAYIDWAGDLSDKRLDAIMHSSEFLDTEQMCYLCAALYYSNHQRFCEIAFNAGKDERYACVWYNIFDLLFHVRSELVEDFFIEFLVNDDGIRPEVTRIANTYLSSSNLEHTERES